MADSVVHLATDLGASVTTAESCTGGMVAAAITDVAGSSAMFARGLVTYSNAAKIELLGVTQASLDAQGAVSEAVAREMAQGARGAAAADISVSITGIAGPGGADHKPEGRVCFGLATAGGVVTKTIEFGPLGRAGVREAARDEALSLILTALGDMQPNA